MLLCLFHSLCLGILEKSNREAMVEKRTANETNISPEPLLPVKEVRRFIHILHDYIVSLLWVKISEFSLYSQIILTEISSEILGKNLEVLSSGN